jgi:hypothetical protein
MTLEESMVMYPERYPNTERMTEAEIIENRLGYRVRTEAREHLHKTESKSTKRARRAKAKAKRTADVQQGAIPCRVEVPDSGGSMADEPELSTGMASETRDQISAEGSGSLTDEGNIKSPNIADKGETADVQQGAIPCALEVPDSGGSMADEPELSTSMASKTRHRIRAGSLTDKGNIKGPNIADKGENETQSRPQRSERSAASAAQRAKWKEGGFAWIGGSSDEAEMTRKATASSQGAIPRGVVGDPQGTAGGAVKGVEETHQQIHGDRKTTQPT